MFLKIVIVLLLLIVIVSLLAQRGRSGQRAAAGLRPLMMRVAVALLVVVGLVAALHLSG